MQTKSSRSYTPRATPAQAEAFLKDLRETSTIRGKLRQWEAEQPVENDYNINESQGPGIVVNQMFRSMGLTTVREGRQMEESDGDLVVDETGDVDSIAAAPTDQLVPGTLIELRWAPHFSSGSFCD